MANDETETETAMTTESEEVTQSETETEAPSLDMEALDSYDETVEELTEALEEREETIEELRSVVEAQSEQIETLENRFLDLSARVADGRNLGVCPECNGPTEKKERLFRSDTIECLRCGEVIHTY
jgi:predicted RNase H-like nuclease (RuvC/YqgF family)